MSIPEGKLGKGKLVGQTKAPATAAGFRVTTGMHCHSPPFSIPNSPNHVLSPLLVSVVASMMTLLTHHYLGTENTKEPKEPGGIYSLQSERTLDVMGWDCTPSGDGDCRAQSCRNRMESLGQWVIGMMVSGVTPISIFWFPDPCILPVLSFIDVFSSAYILHSGGWQLISTEYCP